MGGRLSRGFRLKVGPSACGGNFVFEWLRSEIRWLRGGTAKTSLPWQWIEESGCEAARLEYPGSLSTARVLTQYPCVAISRRPAAYPAAFVLVFYSFWCDWSNPAATRHATYSRVHPRPRDTQVAQSKLEGTKPCLRVE